MGVRVSYPTTLVVLTETDTTISPTHHCCPPSSPPIRAWTKLLPMDHGREGLRGTDQSDWSIKLAGYQGCADRWWVGRLWRGGRQCRGSGVWVCGGPIPSMVTLMVCVCVVVLVWVCSVGWWRMVDRCRGLMGVCVEPVPVVPLMLFPYTLLFSPIRLPCQHGHSSCKICYLWTKDGGEGLLPNHPCCPHWDWHDYLPYTPLLSP